MADDVYKSNKFVHVAALVKMKSYYLVSLSKLGSLFYLLSGPSYMSLQITGAGYHRRRKLLPTRGANQNQA